MEAELHSTRLSPEQVAAIIRAAEEAGPFPPSDYPLHWTQTEGHKRVSRREALIRVIEVADFTMEYVKTRSDEPTPRQLHAKLHQIEAALRKADDALKGVSQSQTTNLGQTVFDSIRAQADAWAGSNRGIAGYEPRPFVVDGQTFNDWRSDEALRDFIEHLSRTRSWVSGALAQAKIRLDTSLIPAGSRHENPSADLSAFAASDPANAALMVIIDAWVKVLQRDTTTEVDPQSGIAKGPLLVFAESVMRVFGFELGSEAIRARLRRMKLVS